MTDSRVPQTILEQVGNQAFMMMGTKQLVAKNDRTLRFNVRGTRKCNWIEIELTPLDVYTVRFEKYSPSKYTHTTVHTDEMVYCDQLHDIIESFTGLYLTLFARSA